MSHLSLVDAAFIFSSVAIGLAAYTVARAFAKWVAHQTHDHDRKKG
jgi:positive regulator of sigma E activity